MQKEKMMKGKANQVVIVPNQTGGEKSFSGILDRVGKNREEEQMYGSLAHRGKQISPFIHVNAEGI